MSDPTPTWADPGRADSLCGPGCRYRGMYESTQKSLEQMTANHAAAVQVHKELHDGLVAIVKRLFRGEVNEVERRGHKFSDVSDAALLMHVEGFITELVSRRRADYGEMEALRAVLSQKGYELPKGHDMRAWVAALSTQHETHVEGFPALSELSGPPLSELDAELADLLAAEGLSAQVTPPQAPTPPAPPAPAPLPTEPPASPAGTANSDLADLFASDATTPETSTPAGGASEGSAPENTAPEHTDEPLSEAGASNDLETEPEIEDLDPDLLDSPEVDLSELDFDPAEMAFDEEDQDLSEIEPEIFDDLSSAEPETGTDSEPDSRADSEPDPDVPDASLEKTSHPGGASSPGPSGDDLADLFAAATRPKSTDPAATEDPALLPSAPANDLSDLFSDPEDAPEEVPPSIRPASADDLAALFGTADDAPAPAPVEIEDDNDEDALGDLSRDAAGSAPTQPTGSSSETTKGLRAPNPAFLTPGQAAETRVRPELATKPAPPTDGPGLGSRRTTERRTTKEKAIRPDPIRFDLPDSSQRPPTQLSSELDTTLLAATEIERPVFSSDLAPIAGSQEIVEAWEAQMRSVNNPPVRFLSPRSHHRSRGSLVLPHRLRTNPTQDFERSWWGQILLSGLRGNALYEAAVLYLAYQKYIVSVEISDDILTLRANLPHGLTGIILVTGDDLAEGGTTRTQLTDRLETLLGERLATVMILSPRRGREQVLVEIVSEEAKRREWRPSMPVAVDLSWTYAAGRSSTARLALGGG